MNTWHRFIQLPNRALLILLTLGLATRVVILSFVDEVGVRIEDELHYFQLASSILSLGRCKVSRFAEDRYIQEETT